MIENQNPPSNCYEKYTNDSIKLFLKYKNRTFNTKQRVHNQIYLWLLKKYSYISAEI